MVQGMAFLSKKGFNPQNQSNRKQVWEAQQHSKIEQEKIRKREEQLRREREDEELCAARNNGDGSRAQLRFMYDAPPGLTKEKGEKPESGGGKSASITDITQAQPEDDAAAAAFRRMLAGIHTPDDSAGDNPTSDIDGENKIGFAPVLQGSNLEQEFKTNDSRSALEKAVGRKERGSALTLEEQTARFPQLKNAPMAKGMSTTDVNVSFKPLGAQLRNVKCLACGIWGHSRGDRECKLTGWDPFRTRPVTSSSILPGKSEASSREIASDRRRLREDDGTESLPMSSSSSSSFSSNESRKRRKRKHRSKCKRRDKDSSRRRSRRSRSRSPSRRSKSRKSHKKKPSRYDSSASD